MATAIVFEFKQFRMSRSIKARVIDQSMYTLQPAVPYTVSEWGYIVLYIVTVKLVRVIIGILYYVYYVHTCTVNRKIFVIKIFVFQMFVYISLFP